MTRKLNGRPPDGKDALPGQESGQEAYKTKERLERTLRSGSFQPLPGGGMMASPFLMATPPPPPARFLLEGPPVSRRAQRRLGIKLFRPGIGYQKRSCSRCGKHLWLGPNQLARLEAEPEIEIVGWTCILPELKAGLKDGTFAMVHLNGRGPGYYFENGKYFGPPEEFRN